MSQLKQYVCDICKNLIGIFDPPVSNGIRYNGSKRTIVRCPNEDSRCHFCDRCCDVLKMEPPKED